MEEGDLYKHREVQENIMSREYRYICIWNIAVVVQGDGGQQGGAHGVEEGAAGGQHAQGVAEAGEVEEEPVVAHELREEHEGSLAHELREEHEGTGTIANVEILVANFLRLVLTLVTKIST